MPKKASVFQCAETQKRKRERRRMKYAAVRCEKAKGLVSASGATVLDSDEVLARWNVLELKLGQQPVVDSHADTVTVTTKLAPVHSQRTMSHCSF